MLPNGKYVGKSIIKELSSLSNGDYKLAYKLSERHILVEGTSRMNVKLAAQFFSNTVANAITYCGGIGLLDSFNYKDVIYSYYFYIMF